MVKKQKIELVFPQDPTYQKYESNIVGKNGDFVANIDQISKGFDKFKVDSIDIWISGGMEAGSVLRLFVNAKGEGGVKIRLVPKE